MPPKATHPVNPDCAEFFGKTSAQLENTVKAQERIASIVFGDGASDGMIQTMRGIVDQLARIDQRHRQEDADKRDREADARKFRWDTFVAVISAVLSLATGIMIVLISARLAPLLAAMAGH